MVAAVLSPPLSQREQTGQWANSSCLPVFVNKVLLGQDHGPLFAYDLWVFLPNNSWVG